MGQAQLLLIVLGVVLVGIAIVAGIQAYDQNNRKSSADALTHDALRMASDLQTWAQKPIQFGGPAVYGDIGAATGAKIGYASPQINSNGECGISSAADADPVVITCTNATLGTQVVASVAGIADTDITMATPVLTGATAPGTYL